MRTENTPDYSVPANATSDATATNAASSTRSTVVVTTPPQPMTESELRDVAAQEEAMNARRNAEHDAIARSEHEGDAVTGTGHGDNRDETGDPDIAAGLGGLGGALVGATAGSMLGPAGALAGAVVGGLAAGGLSGVAVDAVDRTDDDTTITGLPSEESIDATRTNDRIDNDGPVIV